MDISRNMLRKLLGAAALSAALTGTAAAQLPMPSVSLQSEKHRSAEQIERDKAIDRAYQSATKKIPDQSAANDPWADVRPAPPVAPEKKKQQASQIKKHSE
jgi:hypothetical protein